MTDKRTFPACSQPLPLPRGGATLRYTAVAPPNVVGSEPLRNSQQQPKESDVRFSGLGGRKSCDFLCGSPSLIGGVDSFVVPAWNANLFRQMFV